MHEMSNASSVSGAGNEVGCIKDMRSTHAHIKLHKWRPEEGGLFVILILYRFLQ